MPDAIDELLASTIVRSALKQAWLDSNPGESGGHEMGGFVVQNADGELEVVRWPEGSQKQISVPTHTDCKISGKAIRVSFHTHPNSGTNYLQEPSDDEIEQVRCDPDLKSKEYIGEFVISAELVYFILPHGGMVELGNTSRLLGV